MIFATPNAIEQIISGEKTCTRRIVKEGESMEFMGTNKFPANVAVFSKQGKIKWKTNKTYSVQTGRGKPGLWYCPKCKDIRSPKDFDCNDLGGLWCNNIIPSKNRCKVDWQPLRIKLIDIRKECLLNIIEEDAKKEGYNTKKEFVQAFNKINAKKRAEAFTENIGGKLWNPSVWVISFTLKGAVVQLPTEDCSPNRGNRMASTPKREDLGNHGSSPCRSINREMI